MRVLSILLLMVSFAHAQISTTGAGLPVPSISVAGLHVVGNQILNSSNKVVQLRGVNKSGTEYQCLSGNIFDGPIDQPSTDEMKAWAINIVRIPLNEDCWLGVNSVPSGFSSSTYQNAIISYVNSLNANGMAAIIVLNWTYPGTTETFGPMPDAAHATDFWTSVANTFKSNLSVIFDLYGEAYPDSNQDTTAAWICMRDGGTCPGVEYAAAGTQSMVNAVRATGATNIIMVQGVQYTNTLTSWLAYKPTDPLNNIAASWHSYASEICVTQTCWDSVIKPVLNSVPLIVGELGENDCQDIYINPLMTWLDANGGNYLAWAWNTYDCSNYPAVISSFDGTPTSFGFGFRNHLLALAGLPQASPPVIPFFTTTYPFGINVGSLVQYTASDATIYYPDVATDAMTVSNPAYFTPYTTTDTITGTSDPTLYQKGKSGTAGIWVINVPNGMYQVTLGIAPTSIYGSGEFGQDQYIQGQVAAGCMWSNTSGPPNGCPATSVAAPTLDVAVTATYTTAVYNQQLSIEVAASFGGVRSTILSTIKVDQLSVF